MYFYIIRKVEAISAINPEVISWALLAFVTNIKIYIYKYGKKTKILVFFVFYFRLVIIWSCHLKK